MAVETTFKSLATKVDRLSDDLHGQALKRITSSVAYDGKKDILEEVARDLGSDRRMSGWGRFRFGAGYEITSNSTAVLTPRPRGPWQVLNFGRRGKRASYPRLKRDKYKRYSFNGNVRTASRDKPWPTGRTRGHRTFEIAARKIKKETPQRIHKHTQRAIAKHF